MPKSLVFHLNNGYSWVPKMILQPGTLVTSSPHTAPQRLPKIVEPTSKLVWWPKQLATQLTPSKVDSHQQTTTKNHQVWRPKSASTPSSPPPPKKPAQNVIQQVRQPKKVPPQDHHHVNLIHNPLKASANSPKVNTNLKALQHQIMRLSSILQIVQQCHSHQPPPQPLPPANHSYEEGQHLCVNNKSLELGTSLPTPAHRTYCLITHSCTAFVLNCIFFNA